MQRSTITILFVLVLIFASIAACASSSSKPSTVSTPATVAIPVTTSAPDTLVKLTESGGNLVVEITNNGKYASDYYAVVNFYDGDVKLGPLGVHMLNAEPGETIRGTIPIPSDATNYKFDGVATTIGDKMYKIQYTLV